MTKNSSLYGAWESLISAEMVASSGTGSSALPREIQVDDGHVYWVQQQPEEGGRYVINCLDPEGTLSILTPTGFNARSRVHEYGGGVYCVRNSTIVFVNDDDQRIYRQEPGQAPYPITPASTNDHQHRYADGTFSPDGTWMLWVRERHQPGGTVDNEIIILPADGSQAPRVLVSGHDFFSNPRFNPHANTISWLTWDHPRMPWDGTEVWTAPFDRSNQEIGIQVCVAGGDHISIFQPEWSPDGLLYFVSDESDWWNIYRRNPNGSIENVCPMKAEFGYPQWLFGFTKFAFLNEKQIIASYKNNGQAGLGLIDVVQKSLEKLPVLFTSYENPSIRTSDDQKAWFFAGAPNHQPALCRYDLQQNAAESVVNLSAIELEADYISAPEQIKFNNHQGSISYGFYYPPVNPGYASTPGHKPPLIVMSHGGPTSSARPHLDLETQFWTSRGYAVIDVDYSGSVGYGREYRQRLEGRMGEVDVQDCLDAAMYLADEGVVHADRLIIRGSSAGGYVTLCALTFHDLFAAGGIYYGIADLEALVSYTHKFEAHYLDTLIGPYPEEKETYKLRSPIHFTDKLNCPMILMQGLQDKIVPPEQSQRMAEALDLKSIPFVYLQFEHEGHGFDHSESIKLSLEAELYFYARILDIPQKGESPPIHIQNLDEA